MSEKTNIEWCDSTFNPWIGCTKISSACDNCYAEAKMDTRLHIAHWGAGNPRVRTGADNWAKPIRWHKNACWFVECNECGWRGESKGAICGGCQGCDTTPARRRVFCASLADVFDNEVPWQWRLDLFSLIHDTPHLDWLLLTKRIGNVKPMLDEIQVHGPLGDVFRNVWLGATICNQDEAERDIPKLLAIPAHVRFLSIEPLLGPVELRHLFNYCPFHDFAGGFCTERNHAGVQWIDWVIAGGESGINARPMHPNWVRAIRDQCASAGVPFLFKQWGEFAPNWLIDDDGIKIDGSEWMDRMGKRIAGRELDGKVWNEFPEIQ